MLFFFFFLFQFSSAMWDSLANLKTVQTHKVLQPPPAAGGTEGMCAPHLAWPSLGSLPESEALSRAVWCTLGCPL